MTDDPAQNKKKYLKQITGQVNSMSRNGKRAHEISQIPAIFIVY